MVSSDRILLKDLALWDGQRQQVFRYLGLPICKYNQKYREIYKFLETLLTIDNMEHIAYQSD